jgi:hypothetical protein
MIESQHDADQNRRHRGTILQLVRRYGVNGISFVGLEKVFRQAGRFGAVALLEENVQYLSDKGYLRTELVRDAISGVERWMIWLTPQAIDLLDGTIPSDPGVNIIV